MLEKLTFGTDTSQPPILIAHGLFGSARNWGVIAKRLSDTRKVVAVDMRNHGVSPWHETHNYHDMANDLSQIVADIGGVADVIGHSMGGKAAMVFALSSPQMVRRLLVADIAPVAYTHSQQIMIEAMRSIDLEKVQTRSDADAQMAPLVDDPSVRAFLLQSLDVKNQSWRLNLDVLEREMERIVGFPAIEGHFDGPTLFLAGANSDYVLREHRQIIKGLFPSARHAKIPDTGHWLHAEKPREFEATARAFMNA